MGTTLTGTTPQDTYDSLIKVTDNGPISGTLKALSDGLGNDSTLSLSTTAASIAGTLAVSGNATFDTNTLFVDAANNRVGIGTVVPAGNLHIASATDGGIRIQGAASGLSYIDLADTASGTPAGSIAYNHIADALQFATGGSNAERMRITSDGLVGIGKTPVVLLDLFKAAFPVAQISSGTVTGSLGIDTSSNFLNLGTSTNHPLVLATNNTERMRILAGGNVGIGTSTPAQALDVNGSIRAVGGSYDPTTSAWVNAAFATKVSASPYGGGISLIDGTAGWTQYSIGAGANLVFAQGATSGAATAYATLTNGGYFRLSTGGIQFNNDTAAANALDDYEEGTWTMGIAFGGASVGVAYGANTGRYTKIGNQVTVTGYLSLLSKGSSTGTAVITGLPFAIGAGVTNFSALSAWLNTVTVTGGFQGYADPSTTTINLLQLSALGVSSNLTNASFANNSEVIVSLTYFV
jgi:hypothetical protein